MSGLMHTPGPWRADGGDVFSGHACQPTHIANTNPSNDMMISTAQANAHLISASPELLKACEALLERYRIMVAADGIECLQAVAAIAKAKGNG